MPEAPQFQILPALMAQPEPQVAEVAFCPEPLPDRTPGRERNQRPEQDIDQHPLAFRFLPADERSHINPHSQPCRRHPKDHELQVIRFGDVERE
ncbi:hypothetical protein D3C76_1268990 [compost metagenome]